MVKVINDDLLCRHQSLDDEIDFSTMSDIHFVTLKNHGFLFNQDANVINETTMLLNLDVIDVNYTFNSVK